jgi:dihydroneopterin aldolase
MDIIFIHELQIETVIGVYPWERDLRRTLWLDLELGVDIRPAAATDRLEETLDYQAVAQRISDFAATSDFQLVETLAERIAELLLQEFAVPWLRLTLHKPGVPTFAKEAGVMIERGRRNLP